MISGPCGRRSIGTCAAKRSGSSSQPHGDLRRHRRGGPGVHHVGVADEAAGLAPLLFGVARRRVGGRVDGRARLVGDERVVVVGLAVGTERVPERERYAEEPLAADQPVPVESVDPVVEADLHVGRVPVELVGALEEAPAEVLVAPTVADEPLAARDDFERSVAALVELHRVGDGAGSPTISPEAASSSTVARCACLTVRPAMGRHASLSGAPGGASRRCGRCAR